MTYRISSAVLIGSICTFATIPAMAQVSQDAIDGCIDQIRAVGGPDGQSGTVISTEYSEANSLIMFRDKGETIWRCLVSNTGEVADLSVADAADDGDGAMSGAPAQGVSDDKRISFSAGTTGTELSETLSPNSSRRYLLGAQDGQFLYVRVAANGSGVTYAILNPDGSALLGEMTSGDEYKGQLWQSGDHVVVVHNRTSDTRSYNLILGIE